MSIGQAGPDDVDALARLVWLDTVGDEPLPDALATFAAALATWWARSGSAHQAFVTRIQGAAVGMAWVAAVSHVPRPGATERLSAEVQTVFVVEQHRGQGIGAALVEAAASHAAEGGATRVTVHSGRRAVAVYERLGFASSPRLLQRPPDEG